MFMLMITYVLLVQVTCEEPDLEPLPDHYALLNVTHTAKMRDIKRGSRKLTMDYHSNKNKSEHAQIIGQELTEAYSVLSNPEKKFEYDPLFRIFFDIDHKEQNFGDVHNDATDDKSNNFENEKDTHEDVNENTNENQSASGETDSKSSKAKQVADNDDVITKRTRKVLTSTHGRKIPKSKLETRVQDLIKLICDINTMEKTIAHWSAYFTALMENDTKIATLPLITTSQIKAGYEALKHVADCVDVGKTSSKVLMQACNDFYTRIIHKFNFFWVPLLIKSHVEVNKKLGLLEALSDIQIALKMLSSVDSSGATANPIDAIYDQLKVEVTALDKDDEERRKVEESIITTHGPTHTGYSMQVQELFKIHKQSEHDKFVDVGNRKLLYHGSRLSNWAGILGQGLRIAPPEAPVTGYMFGKGVYFADCSSKSANYCFTSRSHDVGLMLICEVALGNQNKLIHADYHADRLPAGCDSVLGQGKLAPDQAVKLADCEIPSGKSKNTGIGGSGFILQYNEYIVYNTNQIKMKYLAKIKFNHKY